LGGRKRTGPGERLVERDLDDWCSGESLLFYNRRRWKRREECLVCGRGRGRKILVFVGCLDRQVSLYTYTLETQYVFRVNGNQRGSRAKHGSAVDDAKGDLTKQTHTMQLDPGHCGMVDRYKSVMNT
jgi:hypothetical protein